MTVYCNPFDNWMRLQTQLCHIIFILFVYLSSGSKRKNAKHLLIEYYDFYLRSAACIEKELTITRLFREQFQKSKCS